MADTAPSHILRSAGDWPNWRISLMAKLAAKQCYGAVDPFPTKPSSALSDAETTEIETAQAGVERSVTRKAYGYLMPSIDSSLWPIIAVGEMNPRTIIQTLYDHFFPRKTSSNLVALSSEFSRLSMHAGESAAQFAGRIDTIANTMSAVGCPLPDHQMTARFLDGLDSASNPGWDTFHHILDARMSQGEQMTYAQIKLSAATYETGLQRRSDNNHASANTKPHCGRCDKDGHISDKCWDTECIKPPNNRKDRRPRLPPSACTCGEMHWRSDCPQRQGRN